MTDALTHATTVPQPLAWTVAAGYCPVLMSDTRPPLEREGQLIGIHASQHWINAAEMVALEPALGRKVTGAGSMAAQSRGALVGVARLVGVLRERIVLDSGEKFFELLRGRAASLGPRLDEKTARRVRRWWPKSANYGLLLTDAVLLPEPIPMRGAGGMWRIDNATITWANPSDWALEQWRKARGA